MKILLEIILTLSILTLIISVNVQNFVITSFSNNTISKKITELVLGKNTNDIDASDKKMLEQNIEKSNYVKKITQKYIDNEINNIINNTNDKIDITRDINNMLDEYLTGLVSSQSLEEIKEYVNENVLIILDNNKDTNDNILKKNISFLKIYSILTSNLLRNVTITLFIVSTLILVILERGKIMEIFFNIIDCLSY